MKELSISNQYFIYSIEGKTFFNSSKLRAGLVVAGLLDLLDADVIEMNKKKVEVKTELPESMGYLALIYDYIAQKPRKMDNIISAFCMAMTDKKIKALINSVGGSLVELDQASTGQQGLFKKDVYIPDQRYKDSLVEVLRNNMLGEGEIGEKDIALVGLLDSVGILKQYFDRDEAKMLKKKLKEIKADPKNKRIKKMVDYTDAVTAACIACVVVSVSSN